MTKITLTDLANLQNENTAVNAINSNNAIIETAFDNTLSRDGSTPNQMEANLDMNSFRIINLPPPGTDTEPVRKKEYDTLVASMVDGSIPDYSITNDKLATAPAETIKGNITASPAVVTDIPLATLIAAIISAGNFNAHKADTFTGDGTSNALTLTGTPATKNNMVIYVEGEGPQPPTIFTLVGNLLTPPTSSVWPSGKSIVVTYKEAV